MKTIKLSTGTITLMLALLLTGCATTWEKVDNTGRLYKVDQYSVMLPVGWMRLQENDILTLSKDGIHLQTISIQFLPHAKAFEKIKKESSVNMLPSELAELTIAEFKAEHDEGLPSLKILHNMPVEIAGHTGFEIHLRYKTVKGLRVEMLLRGVVDDNGFYLVKYSAPTLHYFERYRDVYASITESLEL